MPQMGALFQETGRLTVVRNINLTLTLTLILNRNS
jgi:hypothetical protein